MLLSFHVYENKEGRVPIQSVVSLYSSRRLKKNGSMVKMCYEDKAYIYLNSYFLKIFKYTEVKNEKIY